MLSSRDTVREPREPRICGGFAVRSSVDVTIKCNRVRDKNAIVIYTYKYVIVISVCGSTYVCASCAYACVYG